MSVLEITTPADVENVSEVIDRVCDELVLNHGWVDEEDTGTIGTDDIERWISKPAVDCIGGNELVFGLRTVDNSEIPPGVSGQLELMGSYIPFADTVLQTTITGISNANDAVITLSAPHSYVVGDYVLITGVVDSGAGTMEAELNGVQHEILSVGASTITIEASTTGLATYSSGGTCILPWEWRRGCPTEHTILRTNGITEPTIVNLMDSPPFVRAWVFTPNEVDPFDGITDVDDVTEELDLTAHGWVTGDLVKYNNGGGTTITGLTNNQTYYVNRIDANTISLHTNLKDARDDANRVPLTDTGTSAANKLTSYQYCYVVVEVATGIYRSFGFGESKQLGTFDGGQFTLGNWVAPTANADSYSNQLGGAVSPFAGLQGGSTSGQEPKVSRIHIGSTTLDGINPTVEGDDQARGWARNGYGPAPGAANPNGGRYGGIIPSWHAAGASRLRISPSQFSGKAIREPLKWYVHVSDTLTSDVRPLAELPDLFATNIRDFDPADTIVDDVERFFVMPVCSKQTAAPSSDNHGFLIRNPDLV